MLQRLCFLGPLLLVGTAACGGAVGAQTVEAATPPLEPVGHQESASPTREKSQDRVGFPGRPFPARVAGLSFGVTRRDFDSWCRVRGGKVVATESVTACHSLAVDFPFRVDTVVPTFCGDKLCRVSFNTTQPAPTPEEVLTAVARFEQTYGPGLGSAGQVPCAGYPSGRHWLWGNPDYLWSVSLECACSSLAEAPVLSAIYSTPESHASTKDQVYV
jgi:hypothetical protein